MNYLCICGSFFRSHSSTVFNEPLTVIKSIRSTESIQYFGFIYLKLQFNHDFCSLFSYLSLLQKKRDKIRIIKPKEKKKQNKFKQFDFFMKCKWHHSTHSCLFAQQDRIEEKNERFYTSTSIQEL